VGARGLLVGARGLLVCSPGGTSGVRERQLTGLQAMGVARRSHYRTWHLFLHYRRG
jgi:hypothetical protein